MIINGMLNDGRLQSPIVADYKTNKQPPPVKQTMPAPRKTAARDSSTYSLIWRPGKITMEIEITKEISGAQASGNVLGLCLRVGEGARRCSIN
jgi:hypothetical protein